MPSFVLFHPTVAVDRAAVEVPAHLNVFKTPHYHMKQLVKDIEEEVRWYFTITSRRNVHVMHVGFYSIEGKGRESNTPPLAGFRYVCILCY